MTENVLLSSRVLKVEFKVQFLIWNLQTEASNRSKHKWRSHREALWINKSAQMIRTDHCKHFDLVSANWDLPFKRLSPKRTSTFHIAILQMERSISKQSIWKRLSVRVSLENNRSNKKWKHFRVCFICWNCWKPISHGNDARELT